MEKKRRILIIPSWYPPDGGYFFKEHSEAIHDLGWQVDVLVNRLVGVRKLIQAGPSALRGYRAGDENGLRVIRSLYLKVPGNEQYNIRHWAGATKRMYQRYERQFGRPDLILAHSVTWAGYAASLIHDLSGIPYLVVEHRSFFVWSTEKARHMVKPYYLPFFEKAYSGCHKLVLVSGSLLKGLKKLMPWIEEKTITIPNMIREDMFLPPERPRSTEPFTFLWAGRLEHVKGVDLLLKAARQLREHTGTPFSVRLAGKGSLRETLGRQAEELGVTDLVHFLGRLSRDEMEKEMQNANCFVLPTRYEAFGVVLIEAMASGLQVIATRSGGPEMIITSENGLLVDVDNVDQLAGAMETMMKNHTQYAAGKIRSTTLERYGQTRVMQQYHELFLRVIGK